MKEPENSKGVKTITLKLIGYRVMGTAIINFWGGGQGAADMTPTFIPVNKFSEETVLKSVNDGQFGCESIERAEIEIFEKYERGVLIPFDEITIEGTPENQKFFYRGV